MPEGDAVLWRLSAELVCLYSDILDANKSCSVKHNAESPEAMSAVILACIQTGNCKLRWELRDEVPFSIAMLLLLLLHEDQAEQAKAKAKANGEGRKKRMTKLKYQSSAQSVCTTKQQNKACFRDITTEKFAQYYLKHHIRCVRQFKWKSRHKTSILPQIIDLVMVNGP
ncbi:hypothetical protein HPP92_000338 [Vanilla planifolia]|uniref:Uncharacterized protein n=1 Tax=Vanilla planifolia TaxID=51239 RepID=A0A835S5G5_VANPL|nr:hypothetical protein HPP92_000338 [Vanilla planifolia]